MSIVANEVGFVIGADTHARTHTLAIIDAASSARVDAATFPATPAGMSRAVAWARRRSDEAPRALVAIEGIGSYGARLARVFQDGGYRVVEPFTTPVRSRRGQGKSDDIDAELIARSVLGVEIDRL
ncbi:IS110 family transposase, partial [Demequina rhizosphaerae]